MTTISKWSRGSKIGQLAALALVILLGPFLAYAEVAAVSFAARRSAIFGAPFVSIRVGLLAALLYVVGAIGIPVTLGGFLGAAVSRATRLHGAKP